MSAEQIARYRQQKDEYFRDHPDSPLSAAQRAAFTGLEYYDYDPALNLTVTVKRSEENGPIQVFTNKDGILNYRRYGVFTFEVAGQPAQLTLFETAHGFFLPFVDAQAGVATYGAGRYLDPVQISNGTFHVDFNRAYNPLCAYSDQWECPITPPENRLSVALRAGEKLPPGDWFRLK